MIAPTTVLSSDESYVTVTWVEPTEDTTIWDANEVTGYNVVFTTSEFTYFASDECVADSADILTCTILLETLLNDPYNLEGGSIVRAKV
jgi:hypothetical protein